MTDSSIIGDKNVFAIEYRIESAKAQLLGHARLHAQAIEIGDFQELSMLESIHSSLDTMRENFDQLQSPKFISLSDAEIFDRIFRGSEDFSECVFACESFDDFNLAFIKKGDALQLLWRLVPKPFGKYSYSGDGLHSALVPFATYARVVNGFGAALMIAAKDLTRD